ncbi:MAG: helix-turn-helix transcriptional regulator [Myxococcota bacterium]|nr:helix-turn-helix transcriptional regulator [Myxococcota bacterium]
MSYLDTLRDDPTLANELADEHFVLDLVDQLHRSMQLQGISKAELSRRLGWSRAAVTRFFDASGNVGVRRLRQVARALDLEFVASLGHPSPQPATWNPVILPSRPKWHAATWQGAA